MIRAFPDGRSIEPRDPNGVIVRHPPRHPLPSENSPNFQPEQERRQEHEWRFGRQAASNLRRTRGPR